MAIFRAPTQQFLEIDQIKEGTIILRNSGLRGALMVSSLNFALKSGEEQDAILYQFQNFLNSLDFSVQIFIQSRKLNITGYLEKLKELEEKQTNELLKIQTREYQEFVKSLIEAGSIMSKNFFIVVSFSPWETAKPSTYKQFLPKRRNTKDINRRGISKIPLSTLATNGICCFRTEKMRAKSSPFEH